MTKPCFVFSTPFSRSSPRSRSATNSGPVKSTAGRCIACSARCGMLVGPGCMKNCQPRATLTANLPGKIGVRARFLGRAASVDGNRALTPIFRSCDDTGPTGRRPLRNAHRFPALSEYQLKPRKPARGRLADLGIDLRVGPARRLEHVKRMVGALEPVHGPGRCHFPERFLHQPALAKRVARAVEAKHRAADL